MFMCNLGTKVHIFLYMDNMYVHFLFENDFMYQNKYLL